MNSINWIQYLPCNNRFLPTPRTQGTEKRCCPNFSPSLILLIIFYKNNTYHSIAWNMVSPSFRTAALCKNISKNLWANLCGTELILKLCPWYEKKILYFSEPRISLRHWLKKIKNSNQSISPRDARKHKIRRMF